MLRRQPVFAAVEPQIISSGLQTDIHESGRSLWSVAANVQFYAGKVRRRKPAALVFTPPVSGVSRGLAQQRLADGSRIIWTALHQGAGVDVYYWNGVAATRVKTIAAAVLNENSNSPATYIDFTPLGDWMVYNPGIAKALLFKPGIGNIDAAQWPDFAQQYIKKGPFLLALGTGSRKTGVEWSDGDNWEVFTPSASNLAGGLFIDDLDTGIVAGIRMGGQIAVFAEDQLAAVSYIGAPYQFGQKVLLDGIGAVGKFAVASDGKNAFGVGRGGIWWTDGSSYRYIDEGWLHDYLQDNVNWAQKSKIIAGRNDFRGTYEFFFPVGVSLEPNEGWSFDPRTGGWGPIPVATMMDERRLLAKPLIGTATGQVQLIDDDPNAVGALQLRTKPILLQVQDPTGMRDVHTDSRVDEVELLVKAASAVEFRYGTSQDIGGTENWSVWFTVDQFQRTYKLNAVPSGVYHYLEFRSTATNWDLDLQGFLLFGQVEGSKRSTG